MKIKGQLMDAEDMRNTFRRMAHQIVEQDGAEDLVLIGIRTRGVTVAKRLKACIDAVEGTDLPLGAFDITLYRDDLEDLASEVCFAGSEVNFAAEITFLINKNPVITIFYAEIPIGDVYIFRNFNNIIIAADT